jgi:hypothetical protein
MTESTSPAELIGEMRSLRKQTSIARRAYWLPLLIFGVLIAASLPLYVISLQPGVTVAVAAPPALSFLGSGWQPFAVGSHWIGLYWFVATQVGIVATALWYRWRGNRIGLRTPARAFLVIGISAVEIGLVVSLVAPQIGVPLFGDLFIRGTFPLVLLAVPLAVLTWMERSPALAAVTAAYTALALVASFYNVENILFRLGWTPTLSLVRLPNVALPALLLLLAGAGAWLAPRLRWRPRRQPVSQ